MSQYDGKPTQIYTIQAKAEPDSPWQIVERSYLTRSTARKHAANHRRWFGHLHAVRLVMSVIDETQSEVLGTES